mmetsp:Transcript_31414/g.62054  ORF Transcript_31414/g.62054 Transcript_31414/m.62054 type:complete len:137 (+) Transcript_31414:153-563(+)
MTYDIDRCVSKLFSQRVAHSRGLRQELCALAATQSVMLPPFLPSFLANARRKHVGSFPRQSSQTDDLFGFLPLPSCLLSLKTPLFVSSCCTNRERHTHIIQPAVAPTPTTPPHPSNVSINLSIMRTDRSMISQPAR